MKIKFIFIILLITISLLLQAYPAFANGYNPAKPEVYVQAAFDGHQAWATYPYPGGNWSPLDRGTDFFTVAPDTAISRKIVVHNSLPFNDSFTMNVTGIDPSWVVSIQPIRGRTSTQVISSLYYPQHYPAVNVHQGYGGIVIKPPAGTPAGRYHYDVYVTSVSNPSYFGKLSGGDWIVVGGPYTPPSTSPTPTPSPTASPSVRPSPSPTPSPSPSPTPTPTPAPTATVPYNSVVVSDNIPSSFTVGTGQAVSVTLRNTGSVAWDKSVSIWVEGADSASRAAFKPVRLGIPVNTRIGYNGAYTWNFVIKTTTTATSGTYRLYYTLLRNNSTANAFGQRVDKTVAIAGGASPTPTIVPTVSPTPSPSPTVTRGYLLDGSFESGNLNNWTLGGGNNYKRDMLVPENRVVARGSYGLGKREFNMNDPVALSQAYLYSRLGQPVAYNGNSYAFNFFFYIDPTDPNSASVWGSVTSNANDIGKLYNMRSIGYNHRLYLNGQLQYEYGVSATGQPRYENFTTPAPIKGWYMGNITYAGGLTTFSLYYGNGTLIDRHTISDPGFIPAAVTCNIGSPRFYVDEMSYSSR